MRLVIVLIISLLISPLSFAGDYTTNEYFYLPSKSSYGSAERALWLASLEATDTVIKSLVDNINGVIVANGWTNDGTTVRITQMENNVGIGTTTPVEGIKLDIRGKSYFSENVGIGTFIAQHSLEVAGDVNANGLKVGGVDVCLQGTDCGYSTAAGWTDGGATVYTTNTADNVGIGTTTASATLHVKGSAIFDGATSGMLLSNNMRIDGDDTRKLCFSQTGGTNNERVCLDLDTTANTLALNTSTGITSLSAPDFIFSTGGLKSSTTLNVGASYASAQTPPSNGALIQGNVGIGTFNPGSYTLKVNGTVFANQYDTIPANNPQTAYSPILAGDTHYVVGMNSDGDGTNNDRLYISEGTDIGSSHRLTMMPGGNVGIGTDSPVSTLQINGTATATAFVGDGSGLTNVGGSATGWSDGGTNVYTTTTTDKVGIGTTTPNASTVEIVKQLSTAPLKISSTATANGDYLVVRSSGNVGIGTYEPSQKLQVVGTVSATAFVGDGSGLTGVSGGSSGWTDGGTNVYTSTTTDNVGIGTTTPSGSTKLTVKGSTGTGTTDFIGLFIENGKTPDAVSIAGVAPKSVMVQGDSGAYFFGRDITNDIEFAMGTSTLGVGFGGTTSNHPFQLRTNNTARLQAGTDGNVGIGTINPNARLTVMGTGTGATPIQTWRDSASSQKMVILDNGTVGIGTSAPSNNLSVAGSSTASIAVEAYNSNASGLAKFRTVNDQGDTGEFVCTGSTYGVPRVCGFLVKAGNKATIGEDNGDQNVTVDGNGNVGIGSTSPNSILNIPSLKSTTGTRYLCIGTTGIITSSATACSGT